MGARISVSVCVSVSVSVPNMCMYMCVCVHITPNDPTLIPLLLLYEIHIPAPRISGLYYLLSCFPIFYVCIYKYIHIHRALLLLSYLIQKISAYHPEKYVYDLTTLINRSTIYA